MKRFIIYTLIALFIYTPRSVFSRDENYSEYVVKSTESLDKAVDKVKGSQERENYEQHLEEIYKAAALDSTGLSFEVFRKGVTGYYNMLENQVLQNQSIVTIIDYTKPSTEKRLWIIDLDKREIVEHTLVAHGKNTGDNVALNFSNAPGSHMSSQGFFVTKNIYQGKHGKSLRIEGLDENFNNNALSRAIVIHGASYVCDDFVSQNGRLGRSHGCPAVPVDKTNTIIDLVHGGSCVFINSGSPDYYSDFLNENAAIKIYNAMNA
ncbi:murein L,D-transpeptidase catalytic domain family protein [Cytophagaceae bacterium ABcell3]|nr:murein L,D-transpeptidase catalytic domain family protein [Cytophagaceae bacterium ABcell3]